METSVNNKCKAFTSLEQSRKLAEILPIESADMYWDYDVQKHEYYPMIMDDQFDDTCVRAWSLAALLGVLPTFTIDSSDDKYYRLHCYNRYTEWYNNLVDACVDMIEKLNELKLI